MSYLTRDCMENSYHRFNPRSNPITDALAQQLHDEGRPYVVAIPSRNAHLKIWPDREEVVVNFLHSPNSDRVRIVYRYLNNGYLGFHLVGASRLSREAYRGSAIRKWHLYELASRQWEKEEHNLKSGLCVRSQIDVRLDELMATFPRFGNYCNLLIEEHPAVWSYFGCFAD